MAFKDRLKAAIAAANMDQSALARALEVTSSAVNQWAVGKTIPSSRRIDAIAKALNIPVSNLIEGDNNSSLAAGAAGMSQTPTRPNARIAVDAPPLPDFQAMERSIPVFGTAQAGTEGAFQLNMLGGPIDYARRPPVLAGVTSVFAIYCEGDSMTPWRQPGSLIYVSKTRPPQVGSHVVVVLADPDPGNPPSAYIKRLARRCADKIELEQYNPPARIVLPMDRVREVLRVLEWEEVLGI